MKRKDIHIFKLTHTYLKEEDVYVKTEMKEMDLVKLIKVLQRKTFEINETFGFFPSEMRDVLLQYEGIRAFPNEDDIKESETNGEDSFDYIEIDLYNVYEAANIEVTNEEFNDSKYENENALKVIKDYIDEELYERKQLSLKLSEPPVNGTI